MKAKHCERSARPYLGVAAFFTVAAGLFGCEDVSWPEPQYVDSLRVLAVTADPPTLTPNSSTELTLLCVDGRGGPESEPTCQVEVAWFAQCDNPPQNDPKKCFEHYRSWGRALSSTVSETPVDRWPAGFSFGSTTQFRPSADILANELEVLGQSVHYGTSYVYFAACAGRLVTTPEVSDRLPVACEDPNSGKRLGQDRFVVGFTTLYSYDAITSRNPKFVGPSITNSHFDSESLSVDCSLTGACPDGFACAENSRCLPSVSPCNANTPQGCEPHCLRFGVTPESFQVFRADGVALAEPTKSLWPEYFTNAGAVPDDNGFALIPPSAAASDDSTPCIWWRAPRVRTDHAHLWIVVRDDRGGVATWDQRLLVR